MSVNVYAASKRRIKNLLSQIRSEVSLRNDVCRVVTRKIRSHSASMSIEKDDRLHVVTVEIVGYGSDAPVKIKHLDPVTKRRLVYASVDDFINFI